MRWFFHDLDQDIRNRMAKELHQDDEADAVLVSGAVDPSRVKDYLEAQREAFLYGSPETLETALLEAGLLPSFRDDRSDTGDGASARVLAGGQYAVYYVRAVAQRAIELVSKSRSTAPSVLAQHLPRRTHTSAKPWTLIRFLRISGTTARSRETFHNSQRSAADCLCASCRCCKPLARLHKEGFAISLGECTERADEPRT